MLRKNTDCYICLDEKDDKLISPCKCTGQFKRQVTVRWTSFNYIKKPYIFSYIQMIMC